MAHKRERVAGRIRKILSTLVMREVADPRLQGITITNVEIDAELMYATVYVNAMGEEERAAEVIAGLEHAKGFLRREVAHRAGLRRAPNLIFKWDAGLDRSERITVLLNQLDIPVPSAEDGASGPSLADQVLASLDEEDEFDDLGDYDDDGDEKDDGDDDE